MLNFCSPNDHIERLCMENFVLDYIPHVSIEALRSTTFPSPRQKAVLRTEHFYSCSTLTGVSSLIHVGSDWVLVPAA